MIDGSHFPDGGVPLNIPRAQLLKESFVGTPWESEAAASVVGGPETGFENLELAVAAGANLYHADIFEKNRPFSAGERAALLGMLAGHSVEQIIASSTPDVPIHEGTILHQLQGVAGVVRRSAHDVSKFARNRANLQGLTRYMRARTDMVLTAVEYDERPLHKVVRSLAAASSTHADDKVRLGGDTQALLHHFSDDALAPPAMSTSSALTEGLTALRRRYQQWIENLGGRRPDETAYALMDQLLSLRARLPKSFAEILGSAGPAQADAYTAQLTEHLQRFLDVMPILLAPTIKKGEVGTPRKVVPKVAQAAGASVTAKAAAPPAPASPSPPKVTPAKKAAPAKKAVPAPTAQGGTAPKTGATAPALPASNADTVADAAPAPAAAPADAEALAAGDDPVVEVVMAGGEAVVANIDDALDPDADQLARVVEIDEFNTVEEMEEVRAILEQEALAKAEARAKVIIPDRDLDAQGVSVDGPSLSENYWPHAVAQGCARG